MQSPTEAMSSVVSPEPRKHFWHEVIRGPGGVLSPLM